MKRKRDNTTNISNNSFPPCLHKENNISFAIFYNKSAIIENNEDKSTKKTQYIIIAPK